MNYEELPVMLSMFWKDKYKVCLIFIKKQFIRFIWVAVHNFFCKCDASLYETTGKPANFVVKRDPGRKRAQSQFKAQAENKHWHSVGSAKKSRQKRLYLGKQKTIVSDNLAIDTLKDRWIPRGNCATR